MSKDRGPWQLGRRAWERLDGWHLDGRSISSSGRGPGRSNDGHADDGDGALAALADVGFVRHLLDQAELVAVRTARRHGKSWAEIATKLGVTRQSAWERWRELDEAPGEGPTEGPVLRRPAKRLDDVVERVVADVAADASAIPAEVLERTARDPRRRSNVRVPNVIGMTWDDSRAALMKVGLVALGPDPDGPPLEATNWPDAKVVFQSPESGAKVPTGSTVTLWVRRGGGSAGVREPRRPLPGPQSAREMRYETDEAIG
jgi:PASTA domain